MVHIFCTHYQHPHLGQRKALPSLEPHPGEMGTHRALWTFCRACLLHGEVPDSSRLLSEASIFTKSRSWDHIDLSLSLKCSVTLQTRTVICHGGDHTKMLGILPTLELKEMIGWRYKKDRQLLHLTTGACGWRNIEQWGIASPLLVSLRSIKLFFY